jgi:hypothetical protein
MSKVVYKRRKYFQPSIWWGDLPKLSAKIISGFQACSSFVSYLRIKFGRLIVNWSKVCVKIDLTFLLSSYRKFNYFNYETYPITSSTLLQSYLGTPSCKVDGSRRSVSRTMYEYERYVSQKYSFSNSNFKVFRRMEMSSFHKRHLR